MPAPAPDLRSILLGDQTIAYQLRRTPRRTIGLSIDHRGLRVGAPSRARIGDIENLIRTHQAWVLDKLANWRDRPPVEATPIIEGTVLPVLGIPHVLRLVPASRRGWQIEGNELRLSLPATASPAQMLDKALREHARNIFLERLAMHAPGLGVPVPPLRLSSARTRWGSCNARGRIALNWRLVFMPLPVVDYVVAHELAHLREMNHSPRFWSVVEALCPDWQQRRLELRQLGRQIPHFE